MSEFELTKEIYEKLSAKFPENTVERTRGSVTKKGYDTTGIKYQYVINRLNEVLGLGKFRFTSNFEIKEVTTRSGRKMFEAVCDIVMHIGYWKDTDGPGCKFIILGESIGTGGHTSNNVADAKKGAFTNGVKKCAAFFGVGRQAYEGSIDDDNEPQEESNDIPVKLSDAAEYYISKINYTSNDEELGALSKGIQRASDDAELSKVDLNFIRDAYRKKSQSLKLTNGKTKAESLKEQL